MEIKIKKGYNCRGVDFDDGEFEFEVEKFNLVEVLKKVLVEWFGSEEEVIEWWCEFSGNDYKSVEEVVKGEMIMLMESDKESGIWEGEWMVSEEEYCKIFVDGVLYV